MIFYLEHKKSFQDLIVKDSEDLKHKKLQIANPISDSIPLY